MTSFFWIWLLLIVLGVGGIGYFAWRSRRGRRAKPVSESSTPSSRAILAIFGVFFLIGIIFFWCMFAVPAIQIVKAQLWQEIPCRIISSEVKVQPGDSGNTYSVNVLYEYVFDDRKYRSDRYHFFSGSSSGYEAKELAVSRYPAGSNRVCYVNSEQPSEAVLMRGLSGEAWFALVPLAFMIFGGIGIGSGLLQPEKVSRGGNALSVRRPPPSDSAEEIDGRPVILKPTASRRSAFVRSGVFALLWNTLVVTGGVIVFQVAGFTFTGTGLVTPILILVFAAIGLVLIGSAIRNFLSLFNPQVEVTLGTPLRLGETSEVSWRVTGRGSVLKKLRVTLEGREEVQYTRGTTICTDKSTFAIFPIIETTSPLDVPSGSALFGVPCTQMHTFQAPNNKILWMVRVKGETTRWLDLNDELTVNVAPQKSSLGVRISAL
jgi:hypothetical protein